MTKWGKMPCWWQGDPSVHKRFATVPVGQAIAALKLYIVLCLRANFHPSDDLPEAGSIRRSLVRLCALAGVSKPMAIPALKILRQFGLIEIHHGRPNRYQLTNYASCTYWTKLPSIHLIGQDAPRRKGRLSELTNRSRTTLHALQMYLYIASIRDKRSMLAKVNYATLGSVLRIDRNKITQAVSLLAAAGLVGSRHGEVDEFTNGQHPSNVYWLMGTVKDENTPTGVKKESSKGMKR